MKPPHPPRLIAPAHRRAIAGLIALMTLAALTEGLGIVLLVPLLGVLGEGDAGAMGAALRAAGVPLRLDLLLALFVGLVTLRAVVVHLRTLAGLRFETAVVDALRHRAWAALLHCEWRTLLGMSRSNTASLLINRVDRAGTYVNQG
ncbi:MAG TPA: hypothetical protein VFV30_03700, partial [Novosphingobium sp.]|nr:hypothetical protein [Novosphingobium sp.]